MYKRQQEDGVGYTIREKMIDTYEKIIRYTDSTKFNPSLREGIGYEHLEAFLVGNKYILDDPPVSYTHLDVYKRQD